MKKQRRQNGAEKTAQWLPRLEREEMPSSAVNLEQFRRMKGFIEHAHDSVAERIWNRPFRNARVSF